MRRRDFLAMGAAVAGWSWLPPLVRAGSAAGRPETAEARRWVCPPDSYDITVAGPSLTLDWFARGEAPSPQAPRPQLPWPNVPRNGRAVEAGPIVRVGPRRRPVSWHVRDWRQAGHKQLLTLQARGHPLRAEVNFTYDPQTGFIARHTLLRHTGNRGEIDIRATEAFSFTVHEPVPRLIYLSGDSEEEAEIQHVSTDDEGLKLESRAGKTGFEDQPYVALRAAASTYVCQLFWSGNWELRVVPHEGGATVSGGLNNWRFRHRLRPGGKLELPKVLFGRVDGSLGVATRRLHDHRRAHRPDPDRAIPVQYNSWYPYFGDPTAEALLPLIPIAKTLGCETFVIDAGWHRTDDGEHDAEWEERTGDWRVSRSRFPNGLGEIATRCHEEGLQFGLWFEPEVIAPTSSIRREHPEWLHHIGGHLPPSDERAVLNLGVPEAWQHVFDRITLILRRVGVDWMKWDFNADLETGGWAPTLPKSLIGQAPLVAHYRGLYRMQDAIRAAFPELVLEMCAGGGGRLDGEIMSHAHVNWISDQIGPLRKLAIHFGTQLAHPAVICNDWLVDWAGSGREQDATFVDDRGDLPFRLRVAMLGSFGISAPIEQWPEADRQVAAAHIALYKNKLRALVHHGDSYFLTQPPPVDGNGDWAAIWYAAKDASAGVLYAFRLAGVDTGRVFQLPGLSNDRRYRVSLFSGDVTEKSGAELARGFIVEIAEPFRSELCLIETLPV